MLKNKKILIPLIIVGLVLLAIGLYNIPSIHEKLSWRLSTFKAEILYLLKPPQEAVFNPTQQEEMKTLSASTLTAMAPTATSTPTKTPTEMLTPTPTQTLTPTITPTSIPNAVQLKGITHYFQQFNNCGPANLSMALTYWQVYIDQAKIANTIKPNRKDRNTMPYELLDYVINNTDLSAVLRYADDQEIIKQIIAGGFPVLVERGYDVTGKGWMGHYGVVTGYDDSTQRFSIPDSYEASTSITYEDFYLYWGHFANIYIVIYPPDKEAELMSILGPHADETYNLMKAAEFASSRIYDTTSRELFFAWYNRGSMLVEMDDYYGAAQAYDEAFKLYSELPEDKNTRPWRVTWYHTGPYFAYFYIGRYYDVINLADWTLGGQQLWGFDFEPGFEETWVWRGRAKLMLGDTTGAIEDFQEALYWHPGWWVAEQELLRLGIEP
jgi:tetratricopeptide (TPR) repeat protein